MINYDVPVDFLKNRLSALQKITTAQEREALLVDDEDDIRDILKELTDLNPINDLEADAFLLKIREISVGDEIDYLVTCPHCSTANNARVEVAEFFDLDDYYYINDQPVPVGLFENIDSIINTIEAEKLTIREYNELEEILEKQNEKILNLSTNRTCRKCAGRIVIDIEPRTAFSKSSLTSLYQEYINISMFTNNGKLDIDSLYPFEREIFNSLIADKMKDDS